ncbi:hypothetical protein ACFX13_014526 [Malus domestica]
MSSPNLTQLWVQPPQPSPIFNSPSRTRTTLQWQRRKNVGIQRRLRHYHRLSGKRSLAKGKGIAWFDFGTWIDRNKQVRV